MATTTFTGDQARSGTQIITPQVELRLDPYGGGSVITHRWSHFDHADAGVPLTDYGGYKSGQIVSYGRIRRALSGRDGQLQSSTFGFTVRDDDARTLSQNLASANNKFFYQRSVIIKIIGSAGRAAGDNAMVLARGLVTEYTPNSGDRFTWSFTCDDFLTAELTGLNLETMIPKRVIQTTQFADCPAANLGRPEPIIFGSIQTVGGHIPTIYVGTEVISSTTWYRFLVAGHAMKAINDLYVGPSVLVTSGQYGVDFLAPGKPNWPFGTNYRDIAGRRYTLVYARGPNGDNAVNGTAPIYIAGQGIETVGDSSGTLITAIAHQYRHFLIQFVFQDWQTGAWLSNPVWSPAHPTVNRVNSVSFDDLKFMHEGQLGGGYIGAGICGAAAQQIVLEVIAEWNVSCDCFSGFNRDGEYIVTADYSGSPSFTFDETNDIIDSPVSLDHTVDDLTNEFPYVYNVSYVPHQFPSSDMQRVQASIDAYLVLRRGDELVFKWVRDSATSIHLIDTRVKRFKDPPRRFSVSLALHGLHVEIGDRVAITHIDGTGAGWVAREAFVEAVECAMDDFTVTLFLRDLGETGVASTHSSVPYHSQTGSGGGFSGGSGGGGGGGGGGGTVIITGTAGDKNLGGSRQNGHFHNGWVEVIESRVVRIDWNTLPLTAVVRAFIYRWTENAATTVNVRIHDVLDGANPDVTGTAVTFTGPNLDTIIIPRPGSGGLHFYVLHIFNSNGNNGVYAYGHGEIGA